MAHNQEERSSIPAPEVLAGQELRRLRTERKWSQEDVARRMSTYGFDWHQTTVGRTEAATRPLRLNEAVALAALFEVPVTQLMVPVALRLSDVDEEIRVLEKVQSEVAEMAEAMRPQLDNLQAGLNAGTETYRKLVAVQERTSTRLTMLREIRRILNTGHQLPPDLHPYLHA